MLVILHKILSAMFFLIIAFLNKKQRGSVTCDQRSVILPFARINLPVGYLWLLPAFTNSQIYKNRHKTQRTCNYMINMQLEDTGNEKIIPQTV